VSARFFAEAEQDYIAAADGPREKSVRFCHIWTLKECFLKLHGASIGEIAKAPFFTVTRTPEDTGPGGYGVNGSDSPGPVFFLYEYGDELTGQYILAAGREGAAPDKAPSPPDSIWFSGNTLPLGRLLYGHPHRN
jgi:hypothetical protein